MNTMPTPTRSCDLPRKRQNGRQTGRDRAASCCKSLRDNSGRTDSNRQHSAWKAFYPRFVPITLRTPRRAITAHTAAGYGASNPANTDRHPHERAHAYRPKAPKKRQTPPAILRCCECGGTDTLWPYARPGSLPGTYFCAGCGVLQEINR